MHRIALVVAGAALASCSTTQGPLPSDIRSQQQLVAMLAGKVAGQPMSCIPEYQSSATSLIAPGAFAFRVNPGLTYVMNTVGTGCEALTNPSYALVVTSHGPNTLCSGDIVQVRDLQAGTLVGACPLGEFTPYRNR